MDCQTASSTVAILPRLRVWEVASDGLRFSMDSGTCFAVPAPKPFTATDKSGWGARERPRGALAGFALALRALLSGADPGTVLCALSSALWPASHIRPVVRNGGGSFGFQKANRNRISEFSLLRHLLVCAKERSPG